MGASISTTLEPGMAMSSAYEADSKINRRGSRSSVAPSTSGFVCARPLFTIRYGITGEGDREEIFMSNRSLGLMILYTISLYDVVCARTLTASGRLILYSMVLPLVDLIILCVYEG